VPAEGPRREHENALLQGLLRRKVNDAVVLSLFDQVLASYHPAPGRGLPIGNLTSQHLRKSG